MIVDQAHARKTHHVIDGILTSALSQIPDRNANVQGEQCIESRADLAAVSYTGSAPNPIAQGNVVIERIIRVDIGLAIAGRCQAVDERWNTLVARPAQPTEVAGLRTIQDVCDDLTRSYPAE